MRATHTVAKGCCIFVTSRFAATTGTGMTEIRRNTVGPAVADGLAAKEALTYQWSVRWTGRVRHLPDHHPVSLYQPDVSRIQVPLQHKSVDYT